MPDKTPLPVQGYTIQSDAKIALVNEFKQDEERLLRKIEALEKQTLGQQMPAAHAADPGVLVLSGYVTLPDSPYDPRWLSIARTHFQEGFMALNRAVFQPQRVKLPEDE